MRVPVRVGPSQLAITGFILVAALASPVAAQVTSRASVGTNGVQGGRGSARPAISADGRYVAFYSVATDLVGGDTNDAVDIFVRDRVAGTTVRVSVDSSGVQGNGNSSSPAISADGRFVAFTSSADNLVAGDTNGAIDVFVHDRLNATTERISVDLFGGGANGESQPPSISADGRYVAFASFADDLVGGDTNAASDAFLRDRQSGTTDRVSLDSGGIQGNGGSFFASISADGRYVTFSSAASNLVAGDTNQTDDVFLYDRVSGTTERVSLHSNGMQGDDSSVFPVISGDGSRVAFFSGASNLVSGDTNGIEDVFLHDRQNHTTQRLSLSGNGTQVNNRSFYPSISADGRCVAFHSQASNLVPGDTGGWIDVFVRDLQANTIERVSVHSNGLQGTGDSAWSSIAADGRYVAFDSQAPDLVWNDTNGYSDVFVHDRSASSFASLCDPGTGGVIACPCSNPPGGTGRGCDNSSGTGGASLAGSGGNYLSSDTLVFTTSGEKPTALSIVAQWSDTNAAGVVFGMGVRCTSGMLKRLYTRSAVGGSITAPDIGAGELTVSAQSAAKGDVIQAGQSRWYLVYYRDPSVLGGCPSSSTFNATQTGVVTWWP